MATLLTCVDEWDPLLPGRADEAACLGPTLSLLAAIPTTRLVLLVTTATADAAAALASELCRRHPALDVEWASVPLAADALPARLADVLAQIGAGEAVTVCMNAGPDAVRDAWSQVAAGTPAARWVAVRLAQGGIAASIEDARPGPASRAMVKEAALSWPVDAPRAQAPDLATACRQLGLRGEDPAFRAVLEMAARLAPHPVPLLIQGETGTGKGLLAALIHELSGRARAPFVAVNCAALPETLAESLLFGHRKGSFTGAATDQPGKFVLADGGTLFLDEVGELPLPLQAKLLRVLEDGVVEPLGAVRGTAVNVRVLAATHRDLRAAVVDKSFREDLYFRLCYAQLALPPLRARGGDIKALALYQLTQLNRSLPAPRRIDATAVKRLEQHTWPGNIRELAHVIGRSVLLSDKPVLEAADLLIDPPPAARIEPARLPDISAGFALEEYLADLRRTLIDRAVDQSGGNKSQAARLLGISPQAVHAHLRPR
ncbi:MAG TPA: sigma 54-interacting transcriptional regulator [Kiritimatiellia bacterium]|nr:sigma 54-interacting transcriptional regulator [Kiritimatiellia bacterium]